MKNILVTGGAGFIGSNFVHHMLSRHDYNIINIDALTYAGNLDNLRDVENDPRYTFIKADIRDREALTEIFEKYNIARAVWSYKEMDFGITDSRLDGVRDELIKYL